MEASKGSSFLISWRNTYRHNQGRDAQIKAMLAIFDPIAFPSARLKLLSKEDIADTTISAEVPKPTTSIPMSRGDIPKLSARLEALSTNLSALQTKAQDQDNGYYESVTSTSQAKGYEICKLLKLLMSIPMVIGLTTRDRCNR